MIATIGVWAVYALGVAVVTLTLRSLGQQPSRQVLIVLGLIPLLFLLPVFVSGRTILPVDHAALPPWHDVLSGPPHNAYLNDVATQFVPWAVAAKQAWRSGAVPWRNRWTGCGTPLSANGQSAVFFPLTGLHVILPLSEAFAAIAALKLLLTLTGMWLWLRVLGLRCNAALFGAVSFGLSITVSAWLLFPHTAVVCLWPWALAAIELLAKDQVRHRAFLTLVIVLTVWPLAGHIESAATGALFGILWLLIRLLLRELPAPRQVLGGAALAAAIAIGLTAFSLIPQAVAIMSSNRLTVVTPPHWTPILDAIPHAPAWPNGLLTTLFPRSLGDSVDSPMIAGHLGSPPEMALGYVGITGWLLVLLSIPRRERWRQRVALAIPLLWGVGAATGTWPFAELTSFLPGFRYMFPVRLLSLVAISGAALAAFEVDRLERRGIRVRDVALVLGMAGGLIVLSTATHRRFRSAHELAGGLASQEEALVVSITTVGLAATALLLLGCKGGRVSVAAGLTVLTALELGYQGTRLYGFTNPRRLFPPNDVVDYLKSLPGTFRIVGRDAMLFPNTNIMAGVEEIRTHDPVERRDYTNFLDLTIGYPPKDYFKHLQKLDAPVLDFLNVRYHVTFPGQQPPSPRWILRKSFPDAWIFENTRVLPRAFVPTHVTLLPARAKLNPHYAMSDFALVREELRESQDWRRAFIVAPALQREPWPRGAIPDGAVVIGYEEDLNSVRFLVRNPSQQRTAIVASLVQDGGWRALDQEGNDLPTGRANGPFLALLVPTGETRVQLKYHPAGTRVGAWISAISMIATASVLLFRARRRLTVA